MGSGKLVHQEGVIGPVNLSETTEKVHLKIQKEYKGLLKQKKTPPIFGIIEL